MNLLDVLKFENKGKSYKVTTNIGNDTFNVYIDSNDNLKYESSDNLVTNYTSLCSMAKWDFEEIKTRSEKYIQIENAFKLLKSECQTRRGCILCEYEDLCNTIEDINTPTDWD